MLYQLSYSRGEWRPADRGRGWAPHPLPLADPPPWSWWEWKESNLLSLRHQIYSLARLSNSGALPCHHIKLASRVAELVKGLEPPTC